MFEGLLESILNKVLGQYIQGLNKKDLSISVWSGDVQLSNVKLRADIFKQFKLPLELMCGQIGYLKISVPWKSLGSRPVEVLIENVMITVKPITDQSLWEHSDQNTNFQLKQQDLNAFANQLYQDLIKSKEELAKEAGMMKGLITKIIDNLQISIQNVHVRIENEDLEDKQSTFSLGMTLKSMTFNTTDQNWKKQFFDRTLKENQQIPLYKLLVLEHFAVYYKTQDTNFIQRVSQDQQIAAMRDLFKADATSGKIAIYESAYLLEPMKLEVNMQQYDAALALAKLESLTTLNIQLEKLGICLQKTQYDNIQRLLELTSDFMRFLNTSSLRQKKVNLKEMYQVLKLQSASDAMPSKRQVKELFKDLYSTQLDFVIKIGLDEKKAVELQKSLILDLTKKQSVETFQKIVLAIEQSDLQIWAKEVATVKADKFKEEKEKKAQVKQSSGWFGFGGSSTTSVKLTPSNGLDSLFQQSFVEQIEVDIQRQLELEEQLTTQFALQMKSVPSMRVNFSLGQFKVTLESAQGTGVQLYSKQFAVSVNMFETSNKHNPHSVEIQLQNKAFGVDVLQQNQRIPFVQQLEEEGMQQALSLYLALGNIIHKQSDLPPEQIDTTDLLLDLSIRPIEVIFQAQPIEGLAKFFKVKNMRDHTKIAAQEQFAGLTKSVNNISKSFEADLKNNKISIRIDAPCLVLPFKQSTLQAIEDSECWVFTMGDALFKTTSDANVTDIRYHEAFKLKVQRVKFEYASKYKLWKSKQPVTQSVLQDFQTTVLILRKRDKAEMGTQEARDALSKVESPEIEVRASFDTDIQLQLKPEIFGKLCQISDLLITETKQDEYYINKMNKKLSKAILTSQMKKQNFMKQWVSGTGCIVQPGKLYFFEDGNVQSEFEFSLDGLGTNSNIVLEGQEITLINAQQHKLILMLPTMKSSTRWSFELLTESRNLERIKKNIDLLETSLTLPDFEENTIENEAELTTNTDKDADDLESVLFQFRFAAPGIQLHLITDSIRRSTNVSSQQVPSEQWRLLTYMEKLSVNFEQCSLDTKIEVKIKSLVVSDNSGDERFPVIFENQPAEGQQDLVSINMKQIQKLSPLYRNVDSELTIGFGGLIVFWKPQCIIYLIQFLSSQQTQSTEKKNIVNQSMSKTDLSHIQMQGDLKNSVISLSSAQVEVKKQKSCLENPDVLLKVKLNLSFMKSVFIHPQNHTYPIFTLELQKLGMSYEKKCDCDNFEIKIKNLQVHDNTSYPQTLDPRKQYSKTDPIQSNQIMGVNLSKDKESLEMLSLHLFLFTYPEETGCCPNQPSKDFNLVLFMTLTQIKIVFMMEQTMRMLDFVNHQVAKLIQNNADIEDEVITRNSLKLVSESFISRESEKGKRANNAIWEGFDLMQAKQGPYLDIQICSPLIIIPDLKKKGITFQLDLGTVDVQSEIKSVQDRWVHFQNKKEMVETRYLIVNKQLRFDLIAVSGKDNIFNENDLKITVAMPNPSPFLLEDSKVATGIPGAPIFDLGQVDTSLKVNITMSTFRVKLQQQTLICLFEILNNNVMLNDKYSEDFDNSLRTQADSESQKPEAMRITGQDRQTLALTVRTGCFTVEMRDFESELICEICIVGFDFIQNSYLSGRSAMFIHAGTMFMFHDEVVVSQLKQVMMGHLNAKSEVFTNSQFYEEMPVEFQESVDNSQEDVNFKLSIETYANGDSDMNVELLSIKLYVRQKVFIKISEYFVRALEKLDSSKPPQPGQEPKPSTASSKMQVHMRDTLLILENPEVSRKCIVIQTSLDVLMKSSDPKNMRTYLEANKTKVYSQTKVDIKQISAFFCDIDDIADNGYANAEKRDVLQPLECNLDWEISLKNDFPIRMVNNSQMIVNLSSTSLKLSSDDLFIFTSISEQQNTELAALGKVWSDFNAKKQPAESAIQKILSQQAKEQPDQELASIFFNGTRVDILIINESEGCYVPLFVGICDKISFTQQSDSQGETSGSFIQADVAADYFNANLGYYEPVVEKFALMCRLSQRGKNAETKVVLVEPLNLNVTVDLASCIASFQKLWASSQENAAQFQKKKQALQIGATTTFLTKKASQFTKKQSTKFQKSDSKYPDSTLQLKQGRKETLISHATQQQMSVKQQILKLASPYAIRNLTDKPIQVYSIDKQGVAQFLEPQVVEPDQLIKLIFNLQGETEKKNLTRKVGVSQGSQMNQYVRLIFAEPSMKSVQRLNLNHNNSMVYHNVFNSDGLQVQTLSREKYVLVSKLEENRRVLTVRTQYIMRNQTKVEYNVRVFYLDEQTNRVKVLKDARLKPGESTPLPDSADLSVQNKIKIAVRPSRCRKWSQEFKLHAMKTKIVADVNVVWQHDQTYSILRKEATSLKDVYDLVLQSPMILKNCLPCPIEIDMSEKQFLADPKMPQPFSTRKSVVIEEDNQYVRQVRLEREEEKFLQDIKKQTGELTLSISLGNQFYSTEIQLAPDQAKEGDTVIKIVDKQNRSLSIVARVDTKKAGLRIVFFCDNVLICNTMQRLSFYYQRKPGVFQQDNSNEFPSPLIDEQDRVVYIFEDTKNVVAMLSNTVESGFSEKLFIGTTSAIGDFSVASKENKKSFNFAYQVQVWSASETEFISTRIVDVAPQFILCNNSIYQLMFAQEQAGHTFLRLNPGERQPYHWEDRQRPALIKFKPVVESYYFTPPFSLKDCGSVVLCCTSAEDNKFFRVTRRIINQSIFCVIEDSFAPYVIKNNLQNISLKVQQTDQPINHRVESGDEVCFSWSNVQVSDPMIAVEFKVGEVALTMPQKQQTSRLQKQQAPQTVSKFSLDTLNQVNEVILMKNNQPIKIFVSTYKDTHNKVIEFGQVPSKLVTDQQLIDVNESVIVEEGFELVEHKPKHKGPNFESKDKTTMSLEIAQISVSCISDGHEVITVYLHDIKVMKTQTDTDSVVESYLGRIQIDNNYDLEPLYPVMLKPKCLAGETMHNHLTMQGIEPLLQVYIHSKLNVPNVRYFAMIEFLVQELELKMELEHLFHLLDWIWAVQEQLNTSLTSVNPVFKTEELSPDLVDEESKDVEQKKQRMVSWRQEEVVQKDETILYIQNYKGSPLCLELSLFKQTAGTQSANTNKKNLGAKVFEKIGNFGIQLTSINNAPVKLEALEIQNIFGNQADIQSQLLAHYSSNIRQNILRVAASSDLLGNPYTFVNTLGTGAKKFYYEPRDGFMEGPLEGGLGILKGTAGILNYTAGGIAGSLGKVTNSMNKGLIMLSGDKEYIHAKEISDIKNKPKTTLSGMWEGTKSLGTSLASGVTGVVTKPITGAQRGGIGGFFKGAGMGLAGLVTKPVSGVVDLVSKTSQGIETQVTGTPECDQNMERMRHPRPFYRDLKIIREFNYLHAEVYNKMYVKLNLGGAFFGAFKCGAGVTDTKEVAINQTDEILILTIDHLYSIDKDYIVRWSCKNYEIVQIEAIEKKNVQSKLRFTYSPTDKNRTLTKEVLFANQDQLKECLDQLEEIKHITKQL